MPDPGPEPLLSLCDRLEAESEAARYYQARWVPDPAAVLRLTAALRAALGLLGNAPQMTHNRVSSYGRSRCNEDCEACRWLALAESLGLTDSFSRCNEDCEACRWLARRAALLGEEPTP